MLAKSVKGIPDPSQKVWGAGLSFEPKWDGFRCLVFKDGGDIELASRNTKPLTRYFPEVVAAMRQQLPERCGLDGERFVTRTTTDPAEAEEWFHQFEGAGLDGVVAKPLDAPYQPNARTMLKIKHERTADVVVAGYREHKTSTPERPLLGSML